ncbi:MAG TPA: class I SAM-dependent methyltransferase [Iamia sp.]|nr:class I SAM-dependent methyltransferase [Iamia sp.]
MNSGPSPDHYYGSTVRDYERIRRTDPIWTEEQNLVGAFLSGLRRRSTVLDVPLGTGRYLGHYDEGGHRIIGADLSREMLAAASAAAGETVPGGLHPVRASVFALPLAAEAVDAVVCTRLLTWFGRRHVREALREIRRVSAGPVIVSLHLWRSVGDASLTPRRRLSLLAAMVLRGRTPARTPRTRFNRESAMVREVERAGFAIDERTEIGGGPHSRYVMWALRPDR